MAQRNPFLHFLDIGLVGTFVRAEAHPTDDDYVFIHYVPLNSAAKIFRYPKPILRSAIHTLDTYSSVKGVEPVIKIIYTGEEGSVITNVLESDYKKVIDQLNDKVKSLEMKNASLNQEVEDARAGQKKGIATARSLTRSSQENVSSGVFPSRYGGGFDNFGDD